MPVLTLLYFDGDDAIALRQWKRGIEHHADDDECRGTDRDGDRHGQTADERQPAVLGEHPDAEARVEGQGVEPAEPAGFAPFLLVSLDATKADVRPPARLLRIEASDATKAFGFHLDVEAHLILHVGVELFRAPERTPRRSQASSDGPHRQISSALVPSAIVTASAIRFQLAVSSPRRARPVRVSR